MGGTVDRLGIVVKGTAIENRVNQKFTMAKQNAQFEKLVEAPLEFVKDGNQFLQKCKKPTKKEYLKIVQAVGIGFVAVGVIGYAIKLIHIPIRYLIV